MNKSKKIIIISLYFIVIFLGVLYFYNPEIIYDMILTKYYTNFDNLEEVTISYNPNNLSFEEYHTIENYPELEGISACELKIDDQLFINLIKDNYNNKIITKYKRKNIRERKFWNNHKR